MVQSPRSALKLLTLPRRNSDPQHHMQPCPGAQMQLEFRKKIHLGSKGNSDSFFLVREMGRHRFVDGCMKVYPLCP